MGCRERAASRKGTKTLYLLTAASWAEHILPLGTNIWKFRRQSKNYHSQKKKLLRSLSQYSWGLRAMAVLTKGSYCHLCELAAVFKLAQVLEVEKLQIQTQKIGQFSCNIRCLEEKRGQWQVWMSVWRAGLYWVGNKGPITVLEQRRQELCPRKSPCSYT